MTVNSVNLVGNLTRDVELRRTQSGLAVMSMGIAVNNRRKNSQTGQWEDEPCFVDLAMFGERAEKISGYLAKGDKVAVSGKLRYSTWERDGQKRSKLEVVVDDIEFMSRKNAQGGAQGAQGNQAGGYAYGSGSAPQTPPQQPQGRYGYGQPQQPAPQQGGYQQPQAVEPPTSVYDDDIPF